MSFATLDPVNSPERQDLEIPSSASLSTSFSLPTLCPPLTIPPCYHPFFFFLFTLFPFNLLTILLTILLRL
jgi:hypothetical protein